MVDPHQADGPRPAALVALARASSPLDRQRERAIENSADALRITAVWRCRLSKRGQEDARALPHPRRAAPGRLEDGQLAARSTCARSGCSSRRADRMLDMGFKARSVIVKRDCRATAGPCSSPALDGEAGRSRRPSTTSAIRHEHSPSGLRGDRGRTRAFSRSGRDEPGSTR
jgi:hypothetical protein